jgi:hypothetical protein
MRRSFPWPSRCLVRLVGRLWCPTAVVVNLARVIAAAATAGAAFVCASGPAHAVPHSIPEDLEQRLRRQAQEWWDNAPDRQSQDGVGLVLHAIAVRPVQAKPVDPDYVSKREEAFREAYLQTFKDIADSMGMKIEAAIGADRQLEQVIGDPKLASGLVGLAAKGGGNAVELKEEMRKMARVAVTASMAGFSTAQSFEVASEEGAAVAVVGVLSRRSMSWVRQGGSDVPSDPLQRWFDSMDPEVLCRTYGTRFIPDENGRIWLVAFGRREVGDPEFADGIKNLAVKESGLLAANALAATVVFRSWAESIAEAKVIQDLKPDWRRIERFRDAIKVTASDPRIALRFVSLGERKVRDPTAGKDMWIVAQAIPLGEAAGDVEPGFGCPEVPIEMRKSTRQVDARGSGASYEEAVRNALKDAIAQTGVYVEFDERLVREFEQLKEKADSEVSSKCRDVSKSSSTSRRYGDGFVYSFAVVEQIDGQEKDAQVTVRLCANMVRFDPDDPRFGKPPTIVVLPANVRRDAIRVAGAPADAESHSRAIEEAIEGCLLDAPKRFKLLNERSAPQLAAVRERIRQQVKDGQAQPMEAMKLGGVLTPDYVVLIDVIRMEFVKAKPGGAPNDVGLNDFAVAEVRCRIVSVADDGIAPWRGSAEVTLDFKTLPLPARRPAERALSPMDLLRRRTIESIESSLRNFLRDPAPRADAAVSGGAVAPGSARLIAVGTAEVSLDASNPLVRVGARFAVENPVAVSLSSGTLVERDRVAVIEVTEVADGIAKARVIEGDIDLVSLKSSELVPAS